MDSVSTVDLIQRARQGCRTSCEQLVGKYSRRLSCHIELRLGRRLREFVERDDIFQETWLRAWRSLKDFECREHGTFMSWLGKIAVRVISDKARGIKNHEPLPLADSGPGVPIAHIKSASKDLRDEENFQRFKKALYSLKPEHREIILLVIVQSMRVKDAAARLGKSEAATSMLLLRATRALRRALGDTDSRGLPPGCLNRLLPPGGNGTGSVEPAPEAFGGIKPEDVDRG